MSEIGPPEVVLIAVLGRHRELGNDGKLLWHIPGDLPRFKAITMGYPLIMGRKTFDSIGRPLPGRTNIVLSRNSGWNTTGIVKVDSADAAMRVAQEEGASCVFVIGGAAIYELFLGKAQRLELTLVDEEAPHADVFFPDYSGFDFELVSRQDGSPGGLPHEYVTLVRKPTLGTSDVMDYN